MAEVVKAMARQGLASARAEYWPDLMLGFKYQIRQSTPMDELEGEDFLSAEIGITVPLWFFSRQKNQTRSAEARLNAALQEEQAAALQLERMLADNHAALDITRISLQDIIRSIQPRARAALESAQAAFASGEAEFSDLLSAQMELLQIEMERLELLKQYHQLKAQLQEIIGDDEEGEL